MSYELEKIRTLSQGNGSYKTELYPKTLMEAVYTTNGEPLEEIIEGKISTEIRKFATGDLSSSYVLKENVYFKEEIDAKLEPLATQAEVNTKADKTHNHDEKYAALMHEHDQYALRSNVDVALFNLENSIIGGAPDELNTLAKLANAIDNDDEFFNTVAGEIAKKLNKADFENTLDGYAHLDHNHDERYYTKLLTYNKEEVDNLISNQSTDTSSRFALKTELTNAVDTINNNLKNNYADNTKLEQLLYTKVDKADGKDLSTNDFTNELLAKLNGIELEANKYIHPDTHPVSMITGLHNVATSGDYRELKNTPTTLSEFTNDCDFTTNAELSKVDLRITTLIGTTSLPSGLDSIAKICLAINNDPDFHNTVATNLSNKATELTTDYTNKIKDLKETLESSIQYEVKELDNKIIAIYGSSAAKDELITLELSTLRAIASSIGDKKDFKAYVDEQDQDLSDRIDAIDNGYSDAITELYGGEGAKERLEGYGLESLLKISAAINNDNDFHNTVDTKINKLETKHDNEVRAIYGYTTSISELKGLDTLLKISDSLNNDLNFADTVETKFSTLENKHDDEVTAIYGANSDNRNFTYKSLKLLNDTLSENGTFYTFVKNEDSNTLASAQYYTDDTKKEIYGIPEGKSITSDFRTIYNIQEKVTAEINAIHDPNTGILKLSKDYTDNEISGVNTRITNLIEGTADKKQITSANNLYNITKIVESLDDKEDVIQYINDEDNTVRSDIRGTGDITKYSTLTEVKTTVEGYKSNLSSDIERGDTTTLESAKTYTNEEINKIKGTDTNLTGYDTLSNIKTTVETYKSDLSDSISNLNKLHNREVTDIYGNGENKNFNYNSLKKINDTLSEDGIFYTFVTGSDETTLTTAKQYTNTVKDDVIFAVPEDGILSTNYENIYNIQQHVETNLSEIKNTAATNLQTAKDYTDTEISKLIGSSPDVLKTLQAISEAIGNDPNHTETMLAKIGEVNTRISNLISGGTTTDTKQINNATNLYNIEKIVTSLGDEENIIQHIADSDLQVKTDITGGTLINQSKYSTLKNIETTVETYNKTLSNSIFNLTNDNTSAHQTLQSNIDTLRGGTLPSTLPDVLSIARSIGDKSDFKGYVDDADSTLQSNIDNLSTTVTKNEGTMNAYISKYNTYTSTNDTNIGNLQAEDTNLFNLIKNIVGNDSGIISAQELISIQKIITSIGDNADFKGTVATNLSDAITTLTTDKIAPLEKNLSDHLKDFTTYKNQVKSDYEGADQILHNTITAETSVSINTAINNLKSTVSDSNNTLAKIETNINSLTSNLNSAKSKLESDIENAKNSIIGDATEGYKTLGEIQAILLNRMTADDVVELMTDTFNEYTPSVTV